MCAARCRPESSLCARCDRAIVAARPATANLPGLAGVWSVAPYEGTPRRLVAALKFHHRLPLARRAAEAMVAAPPGLLAGAVVPVPPAPWRLRARGHDPAEEIAYALARLADLPFTPCLGRRNGPRQVGRPRRARLARPPSIRLVAPAPARAVLVDDVLTTGATLTAAAGALRDGAAVTVVALTFARA